ncbi:MAG: nitroreductase, partial [Deltaproteobacteria bacterium]|nr:nitroreductase [Deltaproteobacteria bacterium]
MELRQAISERKSIRVFKPDPVPRELIEKVLAAGMLAPSSANMQPWDFVVLGGEEKNRLSRELLQEFSDRGRDYDFTGKEIKFPDRFLKRRRIFFDELFQKLRDRGIDPKPFVQESTFRFWGAPVAILVFMDGRLAKRFLFDIGTCVQNIVLAAQEEGLGSHMIGLILKFQNTIKAFLHIPPEKKLVVGICLGYPDPNHPINRFQP